MPLTVLTVDDHAGIRELMRVVASDDPRVGSSLSAATADEAVALCERDRPDVILLDAALGQVDGLTLISDFRRSCPSAVICVVSSSPYADAELAARAGADLFLAKGTDPDEVLHQTLELSISRA